MGGLKEYYLEGQEKRYIRMADVLGVSWEELSGLDYEIDANVSRDGLVYGYILQFSEENDPVVLNKIRGLDENKTVCLPPWVLERDREDGYELEAISENHDPKKNFVDEIKNLEQLLDIDIEDENLKEILHRQVFIGMIGALEIFLSDTFINEVAASTYFLERFVETHPEFRKQKISLGDIFREIKSIEEKAMTVMVETVYHKLSVVKGMYEDTFSIKFPDISIVLRFVTQRHDLVHRNGKTKNGEKVIVSRGTISDLRVAVVDLVSGIAEEMERNYIPF